MSDDKRVSVNVGGNLSLALVLWLVMFWGKPDLCDAIIHWLMKP